MKSYRIENAIIHVRKAHELQHELLLQMGIDGLQFNTVEGWSVEIEVPEDAPIREEHAA